MNDGAVVMDLQTDDSDTNVNATVTIHSHKKERKSNIVNFDEVYDNSTGLVIYTLEEKGGWNSKFLRVIVTIYSGYKEYQLHISSKERPDPSKSNSYIFPLAMLNEQSNKNKIKHISVIPLEMAQVRGNMPLFVGLGPVRSDESHSMYQFNI